MLRTNLSHPVANVSSDCIVCTRIGDTVSVDGDALTGGSLASDGDTTTDNNTTRDVDDASDTENNNLHKFKQVRDR